MNAISAASAVFCFMLFILNVVRLHDTDFPGYSVAAMVCAAMVGFNVWAGLQ